MQPQQGEHKEDDEQNAQDNCHNAELAAEIGCGPLPDRLRYFPHALGAFAFAHHLSMEESGKKQRYQGSRRPEPPDCRKRRANCLLRHLARDKV